METSGSVGDGGVREDGDKQNVLEAGESGGWRQAEHVGDGGIREDGDKQNV